jgi:hypothetical protein
MSNLNGRYGQTAHMSAIIQRRQSNSLAGSQRKSCKESDTIDISSLQVITLVHIRMHDLFNTYSSVHGEA